MACSSRLENAILQHDKQVEDVERIATVEQVDAHSGKVGVVLGGRLLWQYSVGMDVLSKWTGRVWIHWVEGAAVCVRGVVYIRVGVV